MSDPLAPNPRNLAVVNIDGPGAAERLARHFAGRGEVVAPSDEAVTAGLWEHHDIREFPSGKYVVRRDPETGMLAKVFLSNEEIAAEEEAKQAAELAELTAKSEAREAARPDPDAVHFQRIIEHVRLAPRHHWTRGKLASELVLSGTLDKAAWTTLIRRLVKAGTLNETQPGYHGHRTRRLEPGTMDPARARTTHARANAIARRVAAVPALRPSPGPDPSTQGHPAPDSEGPAIQAW